jgi:hypothetical protein
MTVTTRSLENTAREPLAFDDRARKVMELRKQVREGTYRPDAREVARAILDEWIAVGDVVTRETPMPSVATGAERREVSERFVVAKSVAEVVEGARTLTA